MNCPNCQHDLSKLNVSCPRCGWRLETMPASITSGNVWYGNQHLSTFENTYSTNNIPNNININGSTIELTNAQKIELVLPRLISVIVFASMMAFGIYWLGFSSLIGLFWLLCGIVLVKGIQKTIIASKDVLSGVAIVQPTRLLKTQIGTNKNTKGYYGYFESIGLLRMDSQTYDQAFQGITYQITYSPHSKRLWTMQKID